MLASGVSAAHLAANCNATGKNVREKAGKRHVWILGLLALVALGLAVLLRDHLSFEALAENRAMLVDYTERHTGMAIVLFILCYAVVVGLSLPGATVATLTGGFLFGTFPGVLYNMSGAVLGASVLFLAARWGLGDWLAGKIDASEGRIHKIKRGIDENQWSMLFLIRFLPVVPFFVANLLPALFGVPFSRFVISTALGIIPGALVYTSVGAGLGRVFETGEAPNLGIIFEPHILFPLLGLCLLALLPILWKAWRRGKEAT
ncbi:TVP38/TMEM64 family protein [Celeribacter sp. PS-C1]|uniref:TVP38/TMEM64 family protein n=1 Tax=Celeribacter sp. PS-C1 TaxID=2820813 RepID=UPI001C675A37|nr:TVP38/TMEM64 family protein [Celeribacter sp. PS-C1]MBW6418763.1 TVP38/TMEM64 family protein [Celeribacter sp. PS-C1]